MNTFNTKVCIVGLGYVGLPLAVEFSKKIPVIGFDINNSRIMELRNFIDSTNELSPKDFEEAGDIMFTSSAEDIISCNYYIITVPTPIDTKKNPDLSPLISASNFVGELLKEGDIVIYESTVYPGVTAQTWMPLIDELGMTVGKDVEIAYCPERFNPGDAAHGVRSVARVIGCSNEDVGYALVELYSKLTSEDVRYVGKLEVAEAAKVIENVQRDINIALVNELARIFPAMDVDVEDVLSAAATKWNFHRYTPGVGVGGHCIPVDPYYMIQRASDVGVPAGLITAARAVNRSMPNHVAQVLVDILWKAGLSAESTKVLFLGWSYKAEVGDPRETPAEPLAEALQQRGISVSVYDPHIDPETFPDSVEVIQDLSKASGHDLAVLVTAHKACVDLDWSALASTMATPRIYDGRRVLDLNALGEQGWTCYAVGKPL